MSQHKWLRYLSREPRHVARKTTLDVSREAIDLPESGAKPSRTILGMPPGAFWLTILLTLGSTASSVTEMQKSYFLIALWLATCAAAYQAIIHSEWKLLPNRKKLIGISIALVVALLVQSPIRNQWKKEHQQPCVMTVATSSRVISRIFKSGPTPGKTNGPWHFFWRFQELLYTWSLIVNTNSLSQDASVVIRHLKQNDELVVYPEDSYIEDPQPHWATSAHDEAPESYSRIVRLSAINRDGEGKISVRRPIEDGMRFGAPYLVSASVRAKECRVEYPGENYSSLISDLNSQARNIAQRINESLNQNLEVKQDTHPKDDKGDSLWLSMDLHCVDSTCSLPIPPPQGVVYFHP